MDESDYIGSELFQDPDDSPFLPKKVRVTFECERCGKQFSRVYKAVPAINPPCPKKACEKAAMETDFQRRLANMEKIIAEQRPPGHIGASDVVRAIDTTAEIVMADHHLTDLSDNLRHGDAMAPKLRPDMQKAADGFFAGGQAAQARANSPLQKRLKAMGARAIRGHFSQQAVNPQAVMGDRKPGEKALRSLGPDPANPFKKIVN